MNDIIDNLSFRWNNLISKYSSDESLINTTFNEISSKYNSIERFYHNFEHLQQMFEFVDLFKSQIEDYDSVLFSIWFHDVDYNVKRTDNEEKSAITAKEFLKTINYDRDKYKKIYKYILRTADHSTFKKKDCLDLRIFLDSDLIILASDSETYKNYFEKIRKEYSFITDIRFNNSRIKFLKKYIKNKHIFHLNENREKFDEIAIKNMKNEINFLSKKL